MRIACVLMLLALCGCKPAPPAGRVVISFPNGLTASEIFDLQSKCAELADKQSKVIGLVPVELTSEVTPDYNPDTNRCYAEVVTTKNFSYHSNSKEPVHDYYRTIALYDAQTKHQLLFMSDESDNPGLAEVRKLMQDDAR